MGRSEEKVEGDECPSVIHQWVSNYCVLVLHTSLRLLNVCSLHLSQTLGACSCQNTCFFLPGVSGLTGMVRVLRKVDESNTDTITGDRIKCNSVFPEHRRWERFWLSTQSNRESEGNVNVSQVLMNCEGAFWKNFPQRWNHMREHPTFKGLCFKGPCGDAQGFCPSFVFSPFNELLPVEHRHLRWWWRWNLCHWLPL